MPAAAIRINGVTGSNLDLPINTLVTLTNQNTGGEVSYAWSIVDQPDGAADALSGASGPSVTFTPQKEGTYLLNLIVNGSLENQVVAAVRHLKTRIRVPAGSETDEAASAPRGWATDANVILDLLDDTRADGGIVVGQAGENLTRGQVIRLSSSATIKAGLPGQEVVPVWVKAAADTTDNARGVLGIADVAVDGSGITSGDLFYARVTGLFQAGSVGGAPALGSVVFLSDTLGAMNTTAGTVRRVLGRIVAANGGSWDIAFAGAGAFDDSAAGVPASRTLQGTSPIAIAGGYSAVDLSANRVITFAISGEANGDLVYRTGGAWTRLPIGTDAHILTLSGGLPIWAANTATPTSRTLQGTSPIAIDGGYTAVNLTANRTLSLAVAGEANGDIMVRAGGVWTRLAAGTNTNVLTMSGGAPVWAANAAVPTSRTLQGTSPIAIDGGYSALDLTANRTITFAISGETNGDLIARAGGAWGRLAAGSNTNVLTMVAGAPAWAAPAASSITISSSTLTGGGTAGSFTLNVLYGTTANTALEGTNDALYVHIAGAENVTGAKTFDATVTLGVSSDLRSDTGSGIIIAYRLSGGVHEFGTGSANVVVNGQTAAEISTGTSVRYVQSATTHTWYTATARKMTLGSGLHVGTTVVSRSNGEVSAATAIIQGTAARTTSASLDLQSTTTAALLNRVTTAQRNAIPTPTESMLVYNTDDAEFQYWDGAAWVPLVNVSGGLPEYLVGPAGSGPNGTDPPFAHPNDANAQATADGHDAGNPWAVRVLPGDYTARVLIPSGCFMYGVGESYDIGVNFKGGAEYVSSGGHPIDVEFAYLSRVQCSTPGGGSDPALDCEPTSLTAVVSILVVDRVRVIGGNAAAPAMRVAGLSGGSAMYVNGTFETIGHYNSASTQPALLVGGSGSSDTNFCCSVDSLYAADNTGSDLQMAAVRVTDGAQCTIQPGTTPALVSSIYGRAEVDGTGSLLTLFPCASMLVADVTPNARMFDVANGGLLKLLGTHNLGAGASTTYLFGCSAGAGEVQVAGPYNLIGTFSPYKTEAGITINGYYVARDERLEVITGTATISADTTLAIITPPNATPFVITMPDPTGWTNGRKLRLKYTGPTHKQDLDLDPFSGTEIDYSAATRTLLYNDAYHFAAYDDGWIILSRTSSGGSTSSPEYTYVPIFKGYAEALGMSGVTAGGGLFKTAEHDLTGGRTIKLRTVMYCEDATVDATFSLEDDAATSIAVLNTSGLVIAEQISGDLSASFATDVVMRGGLVDANNTVFRAFLISAELVIGP